MPSAFRGISALLEVDAPWRPPHVKVLRHPAGHEPAVSRIVFHEAVHYWQYLGQGFLSELVEEDWERLLLFEKGGEPQGPGPRRNELVRRHPSVGFSAHDLVEGLARFWDLHVIGPHRLLEMEFEDPHRRIDDFVKEQYFALKARGMIVHPEHGGYSNLAYDMAMDASAGNYARPYRYVTERMNPAISGTLFPLAGHMALQATRPIQVFQTLIDAAAKALADLPTNQPIHELWKHCYPTVRTLAERIAASIGDEGPNLTAQVILRGSLKNHPVYAWIFKELELARMALQESTLAEDFGRQIAPAQAAAAGAIALDFCLACPGDTTNRSALVEWLAPLCVKLSDGEAWCLAELHRRELVPELDDFECSLSEKRRAAADAAQSVQRRWQAFRKAARGY